MHVSMFVKDLVVSGGYQKLVLRLSEELKKSGHEIVVYTPTLNTENCYPNSISKINIKFGEKINNLPNNANLLRKIKSIFQYFKLIINFEKTDVIIIHDNTSLLALNFINTKKIKTLWMLNNQFPDFLQTDYKEKAKGLKKLLKKVFLFFIKRGLNKVDTLLTYDKYNHDLVRKYTNKNVEIVYAGADIEIKNINYDKKINKPIKLISVGVLYDYRGYEDIITSLYWLKKEGIECHLNIIGETKFSPEYLVLLIDLSKKYKINNNVVFQGSVSDQALDELYKNSDIFIFVNNALTWGISIFEAMSYKLPTIITNNIGAIDLIKDENCSFIVNPGSPKEIFSAIKTIEHLGSKIRKMTNNYRKPLNIVKWSSFSERIIKSINNIKI